MSGDEKVYELRFQVSDAPSQAQSIDVEEWKEKRNEEMAALETIAIYDTEGRKRQVNAQESDSYLERGWTLEPKPVEDKPKTITVSPKPESTSTAK